MPDAAVLGPLGRQIMAGDEVVDGLGDIGRMVADALDILGHEQEMRAERDVARILHHVGQELAEERRVERIDMAVALPDVERTLEVVLRIGVEHVLELLHDEIGDVLHADDDLLGLEAVRDGENALGAVLRHVADALEIARDADRRDDLAQVDRERLAARDRQHGALLDVPLQRVHALVHGDHGLREGRVAPDERIDRVGQLLLGDAAHLGDGGAQALELCVEG
jgi:hypothetical protein